MSQENVAFQDDPGWAQLCSLVDQAVAAGEFESRPYAMKGIVQRNPELARRALVPGLRGVTVAQHYGIAADTRQQAGPGVDALMAAVERLAQESTGSDALGRAVDNLPPGAKATCSPGRNYKFAGIPGPLTRGAMPSAHLRAAIAGEDPKLMSFGVKWLRPRPKLGSSWAKPLAGGA